MIPDKTKRVTKEEIPHIDALITQLVPFEEKLKKAGFKDKDITQIMASFDCVLYDMKDLNNQLATLYSTENPTVIAKSLNTFVSSFLYGSLPHIKSNVRQIKKCVEKLLPPEQDEKE